MGCRSIVWGYLLYALGELAVAVPQGLDVTGQVAAISAQAEAIVAAALATGSQETCTAFVAALETLIGDHHKPGLDIERLMQQRVTGLTC